MTAESHGTLAGIYDWPVPDELLKPAATIAASPRLDRRVGQRRPSTGSKHIHPETKRYP